MANGSLISPSKENQVMKIIAFEEHYKTPAIAQANKNHPSEAVYAQWQKVGRYLGDPAQGIPPGIYDLGDKRIAAMDAAGIDVQILSHTVPGPEELEPQLAIGSTFAEISTFAGLRDCRGV
jgi:uncharacterized protein